MPKKVCERHGIAHDVETGCLDCKGMQADADARRVDDALKAWSDVRRKRTAEPADDADTVRLYRDRDGTIVEVKKEFDDGRCDPLVHSYDANGCYDVTIDGLWSDDGGK